ncbi:HNH endonuclease signature motif containing protein [Phyllobacterium zundukense]|uniref:HNH endonuclease n=1 Tax=Phyllobacterium zundukense TaxID=1867719 RepID=A0ACD4D7F1_9HYPH|nr:HNH endonuclease signature motif containing protein [Phyllobacterium zundukense]UXN61724.1 HNH endonuclease [Phyllobacterium zundukense]
MARPPHLCSCGKIVAHGVRCTCQAKQDRERKARFDQKRPSARARGYNHEWQNARAEYLGYFPTCKICGSSANVVDHIRPHKGDDRLFWDSRNWQPLCTTCHNSIKQRQEKRSFTQPLGGYGS